MSAHSLGKKKKKNECKKRNKKVLYPDRTEAYLPRPASTLNWPIPGSGEVPLSCPVGYSYHVGGGGGGGYAQRELYDLET